MASILGWLGAPDGAMDPPPDPRYRVWWTSIDWEGRDIPTRQGTENFGLLHAYTKNNMWGKHVIAAAYDGLPDKWTSKTRAEYYAVVATSDGSVHLRTTSIAEFGTTGPEGDVTPDGRPIGTVTAYCNGQTYCPDWINAL